MRLYEVVYILDPALDEGAATAKLEKFHALAVACASLLTGVVFRRLFPRYPGLLAAMIAGGVCAALLDGKAHGVVFMEAIPGSLPPFSIPDLSGETVRKVIPGALAVAMLGLAEAVSIARSVATYSHQHIENNREFIGQGLSNIVGSFFSSYASSGSFTRTGVNYSAGAKTPLAAVCSALVLGLALAWIAPLTAYFPIASMSGILVLAAWNLIDFRDIGAIARTSKAEAVVLACTFLATLFVELEFAIFAGVLLSLLLYLNRTSHPHFITVAVSRGNGRNHFMDVREERGEHPPECYQLKIIRIDGSIFYGAVNHISEELHRIVEQHPEHGHFLIVGSGINFIDVSGCEMLSHESHNFNLWGKKLYLCSLKEDVIGIIMRGKWADHVSNIFPSREEAIERIVPGLDPERCRFCKRRVFKECAMMPEEAGPAEKPAEGPPSGKSAA